MNRVRKLILNWKYKEELKNTISEIRNTPLGINSRLDDIEG